MMTLWRIGVPSRALPDDAVAYLLAPVSCLRPSAAEATAVPGRTEQKD